MFVSRFLALHFVGLVMHFSFLSIMSLVLIDTKIYFWGKKIQNVPSVLQMRKQIKELRKTILTKTFLFF